MRHPTAKVSEQMNRKCPPRNTILQLSTPYTDPIPSNSTSQNVEIVLIYCILFSRSRDHFVYVATTMAEYCYRGVQVSAGNSTVVSRRWAPVHGWFSVISRWQSAPTRHVHTFYVCFPRSPQGFPLQAFLPTTLMQLLYSATACTVTVDIFRHLGRSFYLLTDRKLP